MKKFGKILVAVLIFGLLVVLPAAAQKTKADFQKMYMDYLKKKGFKCEILDNGNVYFVQDIWAFFIIVNESNPQKYQVYTYTDGMESHSRLALLSAANQVNNDCYGAKVLLSDDGKYAYFIVEFLLLKPKDFQLVFDDVLSIIKNAVYSLIEEL